MATEAERAAIAAELAPLLDAEPVEVERALMLEHERHEPSKRNLVSTLATAAHLAALLERMSPEDRRACLAEVDDTGTTRVDGVLDGRLREVAVAICDESAGPFDVVWDGNWPSGIKRLRGRMPPTASVGDVVIGGDGGGTRIDIEVVEDDGVLTGLVLSETWRDPPLEDVWVATYRRLADSYPDEIPPTPRPS